MRGPLLAVRACYAARPGKGTPMTLPPPKGTKPVALHVWDTLGYSLAGGRYLMTQRAAQLQTAMMGVAAAAFLLSGVGPIQWAVAFALFLASLGIEALNTAIEL